ncbi:MAG: cytochrome c3 family protein [Campylobacterota bacterium]
MRICLRFITAVLLTGFCSSSLFGSEEPALQILNPAMEAVINEEALVSLVIAPQSGAVDSIVINTDANKTFTIKVNDTRSHYCKNVPLHLGENNLTISAYKGDAVIQQLHRRVFLTSKVHKEYRYPPDLYARSFFHTQSNEKVCTKCHDMSVNEVEGVAFEDISTSNCYQCHMMITVKQHAHAPAVNWLCTSCHNGETGVFNDDDANLSKYTVPDPIAPVCLKCHDKQEKLWKTKRFDHEPADSGRCNKCHNSHASDSAFYLRKPTWELCTGCHKDKVEGRHIVKTFSRSMHPTHGVKDPSRKGKDLSCISCHNPHVSNAPFLLQSETVMGLCSRCHKK